VTESFLGGAPFSNGTATNVGLLNRIDILDLQDQASRSQLENMTLGTCFEQFGGMYQTSFSAVVVVTNSASSSSSLVQTAAKGTSLSRFALNTNPVQLGVDGTTARYCLAQRGEAQTCSVTLNGSLYGVVALLNLVSVIVIGATLTKRSFEPLVTLGDALASFLGLPDHTTTGACLMTKEDVVCRRWGLHEAKYWMPKDHFWIQTPSIPRWLVWLILWMAPTGLGAAALALSIRDHPSNAISAFGTGDSHTTFIFPQGASRGGLALLASLPHLLLAALYFSTNAHLSTYFLSDELSRYAIPGVSIPLRVSSGRSVGAQITSLYLTLPRPWSWLLLALFTLLGFILSQSIFVVSIDYARTGTSDPVPQALAAIGFSGVGLLLFLILLVAVAALVIGLGFRRADPSPTFVNGQPAGNPLVLKGGSCSAVISSRCHRNAGTPNPAAQKLAWGVVQEGAGMDVGHATFSANVIGPLSATKSYA
jgi:hypothetical protein